MARSIKRCSGSDSSVFGLIRRVVILVKPDSVARGDRGQVVVGRVKSGKPRSNAFDDIESLLSKIAETTQMAP
jgi:hypothetical protein